MPRGKRSTPVVVINHVDPMKDANQTASNTAEFSHPDYVVVRRGCSLELAATVSSDKFSAQDVRLELHRGARSRHTRGTRFDGVSTKKPRKYYQWPMETKCVEPTKVSCKLSVPTDAPVGAYTTYVRILLKGASDAVYELETQIVIIFNPWNKEDGAYMEDESKRKEYVKNETGMIYAGTDASMFTWPWNFAQFEDIALDAVLYMMDMFGLDSDDRKSPIRVSRCMAEMVNVNDSDGGALVGLWSGNDEDYADGTEPTSWCGSEAILQQYVTTKRPVKYAQCWVFGGTLTTTLRTLGIPARPITNFRSAHDANANRAIDYYYDKKDMPIDEKSNDSVWNYHVWVEAWMARPDLEGNFGGWQALDATPQELSPYSRTMVVGPAPVQAIKDGLDKAYDSEFVISEVNADINYHYQTKEGGDFKTMYSNTSHVGRKISTKAVGKRTREDITDNYKYKEGTAAERAALLGGKARAEQAPPEVTFSVKPGKDLYTIGSTIKINATLTAKKALAHGPVSVTLVVEPVQYTGATGKEIKRETKQYWEKGAAMGAVINDAFTVSPSDYLGSLGSQPMLNVSFFGYVTSTDQAWIYSTTLRLQLPPVEVLVNGKGSQVQVAAGTTADVTASFTNPLDKPLTNVRFFVEGAGLLPPTTYSAKDAAPAAKTTVTFKITPKKSPQGKELRLSVTAESSSLKGMTGEAVVVVA